MTNACLAELIDRIGSRKDRDAFGQVFDHFAPRVKTFLRRRNVPDALADDITQDAMLAVWRRAEQYDRSKAAPSTWIYTIARNLHIDHFRKDSRARKLDDKDPHFHLKDDPAPDELVARSEDVENVAQALSVLPDDQRLVVDLAFSEGLSHSDVAERLSLPLGTVKSRIRLAMNKLRDQIGERE